MCNAVRQTRLEWPHCSHSRRGRPEGTSNGDLLRAASETYEVLITVDQNLPYQQNVPGLNIAIVVLAAKRNSYASLKPLLPRALTALETIRAGDVIRIAT